ncbi:DUF4173 domain-containing protein [Candidatus Saccharibacteria bacterium]|nr:MAG: DUF4173 domain-containing protein [Candidatus Saccharibacteria bacterium]
MQLSRDFTLKVILVGLILGMITDVLVRQTIFGLNFFIFVGLWAGICLLAIIAQNRQLRLPVTYTTLALINAALVVWRVAPLVQFWSVVISLVSLGLLATTAFVENYRDIPLVARIPLLFSRFRRACLSLPKDLSDGLGRRTDKRIKINRGIVGAVILGVVFVALFASADQIFSSGFSWLGDIFRSLSNRLQGYNVGRLFTFGFWAILSMVALLLLLKPQPAKVSPAVIKPTLTLRDADTILWTLSIIFAAFVVLQLRYLFAGGTLPDGLTYATYAQRGYGQLLVATLLASAVIKYVMTALKTSAHTRTKALATALVILNSIVILSAWKRLSLYEATYGWTMARFVARLGLVCILLGSVALIVWLWGKLNSRQLYASGWYIVVGVLMTAAVLNPEGIIAHKNIAERQNRSISLDTSYLANLSPDAWPAICAAAPELRQGYSAEYQNLQAEMHQKGIARNHGLSRHYTNTLAFAKKYDSCLK